MLFGFVAKQVSIELLFGFGISLPTLVVNHKQRGRERGAVMAAGAFQQKWPRRGIEGFDQTNQHGAGRQMPRRHLGIDMGRAKIGANPFFVAPPGKIGILAAQIDDGSKAMAGH